MSASLTDAMPSAARAALENLVTNDQTELLDLVNQLKDLGISKWIDLPQIIVVGAQSSGKSSVLEAISRISFPRGDTICTTFATEVTLVRAEAQGVKIRIRPESQATPSRREHLQAFAVDCEQVEDLDTVISQARLHMYQSDNLPDRRLGSDSFLDDTLCIECAHPSFPPLTLVDLPGLINIPNERQREDDVGAVKAMVQKYMQNQKSIILAIVSAQSDMSDHTILGLAKEVDPTGQRTLGIITKPDTLSNESNLQKDIIRLASNKNTKWPLDLGWHVLRNRSWEEREANLDERDRIERNWFETSIWMRRLNSQNLGVAPLRTRLATLLEKHTRKFLPEVVGEIREQIVGCDDQLDKLGPSRETPRKQRDYLIAISEKFKSLVHVSNEGLYRGSFFSTENQSVNRIRARLRSLNQDFADVMRYHAHALGSREAGDLSHVPESYLLAASEATSPDEQSYMHEIRALMLNSSGSELPGLFNTDMIRELFVRKAANWEAIANAHIDEVWMAIRDALSAIAHHCANGDVSQAIMRRVVLASMDSKRDTMNTKLHELLVPHFKCNPITYDYNFEQDVKIFENIQDEAGEDGDGDDDDDGGTEDEGTEDEGETLRLTERRTMAYVETYYDIAMRRFVDNVAVQVIEMCLVDRLEDIFSPSVVAQMTDEELKAIAGESAVVEEQRIQLLEKRRLLKDALRECQTNGDTVAPDLNARNGCEAEDLPLLQLQDQAEGSPSPQGISLRPRPTNSDVIAPRRSIASMLFTTTRDRLNLYSQPYQPETKRKTAKTYRAISSRNLQQMAMPTSDGPRRHHAPKSSKFYAQTSSVGSEGVHPKPHFFETDRSTKKTPELDFGSLSVNNTDMLQSPGTSNPPFRCTEVADEKLPHSTFPFQSITAQPSYQEFSFEELRLGDYRHDRKESPWTST